MALPGFNWNRGPSSFNERMNNVDPDFRQMALYDLNTALSRDDFHLTEPEQTMAVQWVLKCFSETETNSEVVNHAVRIVGPLVPKLTQRNQEALVTRIARIIGEDAPKSMAPAAVVTLRENAAMCLKLTIQSFTKGGAVGGEAILKATASWAVPVVKTLVAALSSLKDQRIRVEVLDVLADFAEAYRLDLVGAHPVLIDAVLQDIAKDTPARKRATHCLAKMAPYITGDQLQGVMQVLLKGLVEDPHSTKKYVEVCNAVCRTAAHRLDATVSLSIMQKFLEELQRLIRLPEDQRDSREADEMREQILSATESFVGNAREHIRSIVPSVLTALVEHLQWDPNYCGVDEDETENEDEDMEVDLDDGDTSWKVRVAAARGLQRLAATSTDAVDVETEILRAVVGRLNERVDTVRLAVIDVLTAVLSASRNPTHNGVREDFQGALVSLAPQMVERLFASVKHKNLKVTLAAVTALKELFSLLGLALVDFVAPAISYGALALRADTKRHLAALRPECLAFLHKLATCAAEVPVDDPQSADIAERLEALIPLVQETLADRFFKTITATLKLAQQLAFFAEKRPAVAAALFQSVVARLAAPDCDLDVKKAALECVSTLLPKCREHLVQNSSSGAAIQRLLEHLASLLSSETTRVPSAKAIEAIFVVPGLPLPVTGTIAAELRGLLRKTDRQVREAALSALTRVVSQHFSAIPVAVVSGVIDDLALANEAAFIDEKDLFVATQALGLAEALAVVGGPQIAKVLVARVGPLVVRLLSSSVVQGHAVDVGVAFFRQATMVADCADDAVGLLGAELPKAQWSALCALSKALGAVVGSVAQSRGQVECAKRVDALIRQEPRIAFVCVGAVGLYAALSDNAKKFLLEGDTATATHDDTTVAAATGLGRAASSSHNTTLVRDMLAGLASDSAASTTSARTQHLLRSMKEAIHLALVYRNSLVSPFHDTATATAVLNALLVASAKHDDFLSDVVTESIGRLAALHIGVAIPILLAATTNPASPVPAVAAAIASLKFVVPTTRNEEVLLSRHLPAFLAPCNRKAAPSVRRSCIQVFHTTLLYRSHLLSASAELGSFLTNLFEETVVDLTLVNEVDLGLFKHRVDSGLELRKVAHECVHTLLDGSLKRSHQLLSGSNALATEALARCLSISCGVPEEQETDVSNSSRSALVKVARLQPDVVVPFAGVVGKKVLFAVQAKPKEGHDAEKVADGVRMGILCVVLLSQLCPAMLRDATFAEAVKVASLSDKYREALLQVERTEAH